MPKALLAAVAVVLIVGGVAGLLAVFNARDDAGLEQPADSGPGTLEPDKGAAHDGRAPAAGTLPTSGSHEAVLAARDGTDISGNELLHALHVGNVVLAYGGSRPPRELLELQEEVAGPYDPEIAAAGQAVLVSRIPGADGVVALAWRRKLVVSSPADPALREFAEAWLGKGAPS